MSIEEIQEECKRRFPIGCNYKPPNSSRNYKLLKDGVTYKIPKDRRHVYAHDGANCLYSDGMYAELISLPEGYIEEPIKEIIKEDFTDLAHLLNML